LLSCLAHKGTTIFAFMQRKVHIFLKSGRFWGRGGDEAEALAAQFSV
jgi:hypothetical protein